MLTTIDELVAVLGGNTAVASLSGVGPSAVSNWKTRGRIPPEKFLIFKDALAKLNKRADPALFGFESTEARP